QKICNTAIENGIPADKIILDPGVGFAKTYEDNLYVLNHLDIMNSFGCPWLLGTSRKSVIGKTLDLPTDERLEGTLATTALGVFNKASFVRVHDVKENKRFITMLEVIRNA
ncbi:MAG: dihydropteroate synthase, partial [Lachnospiraceae bacterium]|nr:dihydropteroate synthase [Lachnospiraceae bacterium]